MGATMGKSGANFLDALPTQGTLHVVMLGLDSAGKTTALYRLKFDQYLNTVPTIGFNCEKVQGTVGKAKGVQFLVWDVGGQEKLRPLWRSYTRCTDGILFVVDSVDVERMEEAKMELMRTAKCPDNQGVPVLVLANKQDLPAAREPKELEKLLGLHELSPMYPSLNLTSMSSSSSSTGNIVGGTSGNSVAGSHTRSLTPTTQHNKSFAYSGNSSIKETPSIQYSTLSSSATTLSSTSTEHQESGPSQINLYQQKHTHTIHSHHLTATSASSPSSAATTPTTSTSNQIITCSKTHSTTIPAQSQHFKGWYIQPACAITGEGLQEGLEALYEMILRRRKMNKAHKKKR